MKLIKQNWWDKFFMDDKHCLPVQRYEKKFIADIRKNSRVLDLGCGEGWLGKVVVENKLSYVGIDSSLYALGRVSITLAKYPKISLLNYDLENLPSGLEADVILLRFVLAHIKNKNRFIKTVSKILKPGGQLYILTPTRTGGKYPTKYRSISILDSELKGLLLGFKVKPLKIRRYPKYQMSLGAYVCQKI